MSGSDGKMKNKTKIVMAGNSSKMCIELPTYIRVSTNNRWYSSMNFPDSSKFIIPQVISKRIDMYMHLLCIRKENVVKTSIISLCVFHPLRSRTEHLWNGFHSHTKSLKL